MSNVASLELSKKLFELSGWNDTDGVWRLHKPNGASAVISREKMRADNYRFRNSPEAPRFREENEFFSAYTAGYLLRKLPVNLQFPEKYEKPVPDNGDRFDRWNAEDTGTAKLYVGAMSNDPGKWWAGYQLWNTTIYGYKEDTPENALAKLAIVLFEQNLLTKEAKR